jgi:endonuclease/exonuclease/phosphatase (EEP) superfamily protein YafD
VSFPSLAAEADPQDDPDTPGWDDAHGGPLRNAVAARGAQVRELVSNTPLANLLLLVLAIGLALWSGLSFVAGPHSSVIAFAAVTPMVSVIAVPVIAFAARGRQWVTVAVGTMAAVLPWGLVAGYAVPSAEPPQNALSLRVMTVNTHLGNADPEQIVTAARANGVDLLVLAEVNDAMTHELTVAGIDAVVQARWLSEPERRHGRLGLWSRYSVDPVVPVLGTTLPTAQGTLHLGEVPVEFVATQVASPFPPRFPFVFDSNRWHQDLRRLTEVVGTSTAPHRILVGDLGATPWNADYRALTAATGLRDAGDVVGRGLRPTWPAWGMTPLAPLDHVLVSDRIGVRSMGTVLISGATHRALMVDLAIPRPA